MERITSLQNSYIKYLDSLKQKKTRDIEKKFLVEGYHLVEEAKKANRLSCCLITNEVDSVSGVRNILVTDSIIAKLSNTKTPQSIIGVCDICDSEVEIKNRYVILDGVQDPGNIGTIIRTSLGFNIDGIILSPDCCDVYNDKVVRSTQGALFNIDIIRCDLTEMISKLKSHNITIVSTSLKGTLVDKVDAIDKFALILGNEGNGVKEEIQKLSDINVKINISDKLESLNVAIAGAIMMYALSK